MLMRAILFDSCKLMVPMWFCYFLLKTMWGVRKGDDSSLDTQFIFHICYTNLIRLVELLHCCVHLGSEIKEKLDA